MAHHRIFISYARADGESAARRLYDELQIAGSAAWLDVFDIPAGADWNAEIDRALRAAPLVIVLLTPGAVESRQVTAEWNEALGLGRTVVPLLIAECEVPRVLKTLNWIDFTPGWDAGLAALRRRVRELEDGGSAQRQRIDAAVAETRQALLEGSERRSALVAERAVGRPPSSSVAYFRDRDEARAALSELLAREPSVRAVSVIGRGGMGKTALACTVLAGIERNEWAHAAADVAPIDGIVYLSTRTAGISLERLFLDCARMLGAAEEAALGRTWSNAQLPVEEKVERLLRALAGGRYIILLDNVEDLLDDAGRIADDALRVFVDACLTTMHGVRLVLTTRTPVAFGRHALRFDHRVMLDDGLPREEAVALLRELDASGTANLRDADDAALARAVERVHRLPRALEVLAGILKDDAFLTLDALLDRFYEEDDVVSELIATGYRRLDEPSRHVLQALAVLGRPAPLAAVEFLLAPFVPGLDAGAAARRLHELHMVHVDRAARTLSLHPIDREIVYASLPEVGVYSRRSLDRQAANYYARLRLPPERRRTIDDIMPQILEFEHRVRAHDYDAAADVLSEIDVAALIWHGNAERAQEMRAQLDGHLQSPRALMLHAFALGHIHMIVGPLSEAAAHFREAGAQARALADEHSAVEAMGFEGEAARRMGRLDVAIERVGSTVAHYRTAGDARAEAWWLLLLGLARAFAGAADAALADGTRAVALAEAIADREVLGRGHSCVALAQLLRGRYDDAIAHARRAAALYREVGWTDSVGYAVNVEALATLQLGQHDDALRLFDEVRTLGHEEGQPRIEGIGLFNIATVQHRNSRVAEALPTAEAAHVALRRVGAAEADAAACLVDALRARLRNDPAAESAALAAARRHATPDLAPLPGIDA